MDLAHAFVSSATNHPERTAIYWGKTSISYKDLLLHSESVRQELVHEHGIQQGERVALWMKNSPTFVSVLFGILRAGGVVVPINHFLTADEGGFIIQDSGAKVVYVDEFLLASARCIQQGQSQLQVLRAGNVTHATEGMDDAINTTETRLENDLALIIYTSGTTGKPKGAMLSHGNLLHNIHSCEYSMQVVEQDRIALLLPMFHSFMIMVGILLPVKVGASIVLIKSLHSPRKILQEIKLHQATVMPAIPQLYRAFAKSEIHSLPLRLCISGAAPLPLEILKRFNSKSNTALIESYGLSEASPVVTLNPVEGPWKAGSVGLPVHDVTVAVMDTQGNLMKPGMTGELWVRGGNVMMGYWNRPKATAETLQDGWLKTGDMGYADEDGYLYITDRKKDMLLVNGINVYPREIEECMYRFEGVKEAAVIGCKDERKGEKPVAYVVLENDIACTEKELQDFLKSQLAPYKIPREVHFLKALPRNATGKILKTALRKLLKVNP
ncbi:MAG: long-chain fatty acid--CoA ligase [Verrucomicrobiota bacterium]|nr:long-chain fatty acid--CoA ligase [Verrucomicrobiota bacterium]